MAGMNPLPTHHIHSRTRLTHREAHTFLSSFLQHAEADASYRPDSTLTERGPQSASTGSNPNLTLHHLRRILTGIEGKKVGGDLVEGLGYAEDGPNGAITDGTLNNKTGSKRPFDSQDNPRASKRNVYEVIDDRAGPADDDDAPAIGVTAEEEDDWQDKDEYALAQTEGTLDMLEEDRHPGAHLEQPTNPEEEEELVNIEIEETGEKVDPRKQRGRDGDGGTARRKSQAESAMSKEERKRQKKMRQKEIRTNINEEKRKKASKE